MVLRSTPFQVVDSVLVGSGASVSIVGFVKLRWIRRSDSSDEEVTDEEEEEDATEGEGGESRLE